MLDIKYSKIIILLFLCFIYTNAVAQYEQKKQELRSKLLIFKKQYEALKMEAEALIDTAQHINISDDEKCLSVAREMMSLDERINSFSKALMEYYTQAGEIFDRSYFFNQQLKYGKSAGQIKELEKHSLLFQTSTTMHNSIGMFTHFLISQNAIYLKAALKYEEVWKLFEKETYR